MNAFGRARAARRVEDLDRDVPQDRADALAVHEDVDAEARQAGDLVGEVGVARGLELLAVVLGHDRPKEVPDLLGRKRSARFVRTMSPSRRSIGISPLVMWRSEALRVIISRKNRGSGGCRLRRRQACTPGRHSASGRPRAPNPLRGFVPHRRARARRSARRAPEGLWAARPRRLLPWPPAEAAAATSDARITYPRGRVSLRQGVVSWMATSTLPPHASMVTLKGATSGIW